MHKPGKKTQAQCLGIFVMIKLSGTIVDEITFAASTLFAQLFYR